MPRAAVRVLHAGHLDDDGRLPAGGAGPDAGAHSQRAWGEPVPVHGLSEHHHRGSPGRRSPQLLIDVHSHYMPKAVARALEQRAETPRIFKRDGKMLIEYGERSVAPLAPVFFEPELILEQMHGAGIDHAVLSVSIPGVDWLGAEHGEDVAEAANEETASIVGRYRIVSAGWRQFRCRRRSARRR